LRKKTKKTIELCWLKVAETCQKLFLIYHWKSLVCLLLTCGTPYYFKYSCDSAIHTRDNFKDQIEFEEIH